MEQSYATGSPNQRKVVFGRRRFWTFFSNGKDLVYRTSHDGIIWNSEMPTRISAGPAAESVSIWHDKETYEISYSMQKHRDGVLELGRGILESNGTISWSDPPLLVRTKFPGQFPGTFVCSKKQGETWGGTTTIEGEQNRHTEIWRSEGREAELVYDVNFGPGTAIRPPIILPAAKGVLLVYGRTHHSDRLFITSTEDAKDWTAVVSPTNDFCLGGAAIIGDRLYYCGPSNGTCRFFTFRIGGKNVEGDFVLEPRDVTQATMATDGEKRLVAIYSSMGAHCSIFCRVSSDLGETWKDRMTLVEGEPIAGFSLTASRDVAEGEVGVSWSSGTKAPYRVRFGKIRV